MEDSGTSKKPLCVAHVIPGLGPGGAETLLYRLARVPSPVEHHVISLSGPDWYSDPLKDHGVAVHHLNMHSPFGALAALARLRRTIKEIRPDVIQGWMYRSNVLAGPIAKLSGIPLVWGIHCSSLDSLPLSSRILARLSGLMAGRAADYIVNCSSTSVGVHSKLGYSAVPGMVVPNGYDAGEFYPDEASRRRTRALLGISDDTFVVGSVTRWNSYKAVPDLLKAIATVSHRGVPVRCLLIGNGLDVTNRELAEAIQKAGCGTALLPLGRRSDIVDLARAMDVHALPSLTEAFPNVVAETMLSGTPNVATDVGDTSLIIGDTGWIVRPGDPDRLADAMEAAYHEWKDQPDRWAARRQAARRQIADNFAFEAMARAYEEVWRKVSNGHHAQ